MKDKIITEELKLLHKLLHCWNSRNKAISSFTLGFVTPSTNIAHNKLKSEIAELMNFCFNCGDNARLGAMWKNNKIIVCI